MVNRAQAIRRLSDNRDDIIIMSMVPQGHGPGVLPFPQQPDHRRWHRPGTRCTSLSNCAIPGPGASPTLLVREQGSGTRKACEEYFKDKRVHFTQTLEVASADAPFECVIAGLGDFTTADPPCGPTWNWPPVR